MSALANHGYSYSSDVSIKMLDAAVKSSSKYDSIQEVIDAMKADQTMLARPWHRSVQVF